jgi:hypothetical protein
MGLEAAADGSSVLLDLSHLSSRLVKEGSNPPTVPGCDHCLYGPLGEDRLNTDAVPISNRYSIIKAHYKTDSHDFMIS